MTPTSWNLLRPPPDAVERLERELGVSATLARVLVNRGAADPESASRFLEPSLAQLHDPLAMRGMTDAVYAVARAVRERRRILVWGDYDVDGVTGTVLLVDFLRRHTPAVDYHIPHRIDDGYGLDAAAVRRFAAAGVSLVVTVDCGISERRGDRRGPRGSASTWSSPTTTSRPPGSPRPARCSTPAAPAAATPSRAWPASASPSSSRRRVARLIGPGASAGGDELLHSYLDLVALGTVADIAPLVGENRVLVRHGLDVLGSGTRPGVRALLQTAGIETRPLRAAQIGFGLGPRINAAGRLDRAGTAVELFLSDDQRQALRLAELLERQNTRRREIEAQIRVEAIRIVEGGDMDGDRVLVLSAPDWHPGVIGIVAAKISERYSRPALLVSSGRDPGKGSARSVADVNLYAELCRVRHLFTSLGGHAHAAGFSIREADIPELRRELNLTAPGAAPAAAGRRIDIDADLDFADLRPALVEELRRLAPFGHGNPEPAFATRAVRLAQAPRTVGNNHLRLTLAQKPHTRSFIGFNLGGFAGDLAAGLGIDVAYDLDLEGGSHGGWQRYRLRDIRIPYERSPAGAAR